ncbi:MAG TPA: ECF-type sigma factor [Phycisphaerae bacterium]|nr:ECF-type sigma factor [Phycisphaerae bacterium]
MASKPHNITILLQAISAGETDAWEQLLALIYDELRRLAGRQVRRERRGHTLPRTALVNEAYLRLMGDKQVHWQNRAHFFAAAADAMRRIMVDYARRRKAEKRGGKADRLSLDEGRNAGIAAVPAVDGPAQVDLEALDEALSKLEADEKHREKCTIVKLRYFVGLSVEETAKALGKSPATVKRDWAFAKAWLYREMTKDDHL